MNFIGIVGTVSIASTLQLLFLVTRVAWRELTYLIEKYCFELWRGEYRSMTTRSDGPR